VGLHFAQTIYEWMLGDGRVNFHNSMFCWRNNVRLEGAVIQKKRQACEESRQSALNTTLPEFAAQHGRLQQIGIYSWSQQLTSRTPLLLSIDGTDRLTETNSL